MSIYDEIKQESAWQENKWGNKFDDNHSPYHWAGFITAYTSRHLVCDPATIHLGLFRADMVKVAALAVAAIEVLDRK